MPHAASFAPLDSISCIAPFRAAISYIFHGAWVEFRNERPHTFFNHSDYIGPDDIIILNHHRTNDLCNRSSTHVLMEWNSQ